MTDEQTQEDALTEEFEKSFNTEETGAVVEEDVLPIEDDLEEPQAVEMIVLKQELKAEKDKYFRLLAESENLRKRMQKEKEEMMRFAIENVIAEFIAPLDQLEKALHFAEKGTEEVKHWAKGFEMIMTQFNDVLAQHNVTHFTSLGKLFDPHSHEAIELTESDQHEEGTIVEEFTKGYRCGDRIIRPARVKVTKKKQENKVNEPEEKK